MYHLLSCVILMSFLREFKCWGKLNKLSKLLNVFIGVKQNNSTNYFFKLTKMKLQPNRIIKDKDTI